MSKIIAIDYGKKRSGIAETDDLQIIASGLTTVETPKLFDFLESYFNKNIVECVVVGKPTQMNGEPSESAVYVNEFMINFHKKFPQYLIIEIDERFTSKMASQSMITSGLKKKKRQDKGLIDEIAATILLQDFLNYRK